MFAVTRSLDKNPATRQNSTYLILHSFLTLGFFLEGGVWVERLKAAAHVVTGGVARRRRRPTGVQRDQN